MSEQWGPLAACHHALAHSGGGREVVRRSAGRAHLQRRAHFTGFRMTQEPVSRTQGCCKLIGRATGQHRWLGRAAARVPPRAACVGCRRGPGWQGGGHRPLLRARPQERITMQSTVLFIPPCGEYCRARGRGEPGMREPLAGSGVPGGHPQPASTWVKRTTQTFNGPRWSEQSGTHEQSSATTSKPE